MEVRDEGIVEDVGEEEAPTYLGTSSFLPRNKPDLTGSDIYTI